MTTALSTQPTVIEPPSGWPGFGLTEAWRFRSICFVLARRSLKVRYRQTAIGAVWAVLTPLALMAIFTIFFGVLARLPSDGVPFPVFFFSALSVWQVMAKVLNEGTGSVVANSALVNRVYFPRVYFPLSVALASLVDLMFNLLALGVLLLLFGRVPGLAIVVTPILIAIAYVTCLGVVLWLSALNVAYRDVAVLLPLIVQSWFFITPVIYTASIVPAHWHWLYYMNPMALVVTGMRWALLRTPAPPPEAWPLAIVVGAAVFLSGYVFFRRRESNFSDVV
jgi:lipopolysaccharide transport system permease protein